MILLQRQSDQKFFAGIDHKSEPVWSDREDDMVYPACVFLTEGAAELTAQHLQDVIGESVAFFP